MPLDRPPAAGVLVALSVHAVAGELVLRAEDELIPGGTLRDAAVALRVRPDHLGRPVDPADLTGRCGDLGRHGPVTRLG